MDRKLIDYLPIFVQNYAEIRAIMDSEQVDVVNVWVNADNVMNDQFVTEATENGIKRWEAILDIVPKTTYTLDERKFTILARLNEQLPYTVESLKVALTSLCGIDGYVVEMHPDEYEILVKLGLANKKNYDDVCRLLDKMIPANIVKTVVLLYNSNEKLRTLTHGQLALYTHKWIREEDF